MQYSWAPERGNLYLLPCFLVGTAYDVEKCPLHAQNEHTVAALSGTENEVYSIQQCSSSNFDNGHLDKVN